MPNLFRSEAMSLVRLFIQTEAAYATLSELGQVGLLQFRDMNPEVNSFQRTFVKEIRRAEEMERKLRFLATQLDKAEVKIKTNPDVYMSRPRNMNETDELETRLADLEKELNQINTNDEVLSRNFVELTEMKHVLTNTQIMMAEYDHGGNAVGNEDLLQARSMKLNFVTGVLDRTRRLSFERILWRVLRGNMYLKVSEIEEPIKDPITNVVVHKISFIVFVQGEQLLGKIRKISESFGATIYPSPESSEEREALLRQVTDRLQDLTSVLNKTKEHRRRVLAQVAEQIEEWSASVKKEKAIFHTMNLFNVDYTSRCLVGEGWCPTNAIPVIRQALEVATERSQTQVPSILNGIPSPKHVPPTYNKTNKFTEGFQTIIDAYGIANYQEVNPAYFSIISFPFLFSVMFGDFGHGILVSIFAIYICAREKQLTYWAKDEIFGMIYGGRYIILFLGLFSMFSGLIYNEIFSLAMDIFGTGWEFPLPSANQTSVEGTVEGTQTHVYAFGVDPAWSQAENGLIFINSYKMKLSILLGVLQMTLGVVLSLLNHLHFRNYISAINEFIPRMLFLQCIFGYLCVMIIYKWCIDWIGIGAEAPSLLTMLINMFLSPGSLNQAPLYDGQVPVQKALLTIALLSIPWMLLVKPFLLKRKHTAQKVYASLHQEESSGGSHQTEDSKKSDAAAGAHGGGDHEGFDFGEVMIHQTIETIEFCLGTISHTASYLRLWALSLAHSELSIVLWQMTMEKIYTLNLSTGLMTFGIFGAFALWFVLTIFILLGMEGLSAFLHALRLHWVEFNQKFYVGEGYKFLPFSFKRIIAGDDDDA